MEYGLKYFFYLEEENVCHRYIQIGMESENGEFTGMIIDYAGGGEYGNFYFIDGEYLNDREKLEGGDDDVFEDELEDAYPDFLDQMYHLLDLYAEWNEEDRSYRFTEAFIEEFGPFDGGEALLIGEDNLRPIGVGNSWFTGWKTLDKEYEDE